MKKQIRINSAAGHPTLYIINSWSVFNTVVPLSCINFMNDMANGFSFLSFTSLVDLMDAKKKKKHNGNKTTESGRVAEYFQQFHDPKKKKYASEKSFLYTSK